MSKLPWFREHLPDWLSNFWLAAKGIATPSRLIFALKTFLLSLAYYASGIGGALLALPPGYASPIWPPAGIALSATLLLGWRAIPGILLGSFFVTYWVPFEIFAELKTQQSIEVAAIVALGACLQAWAGAFLIRRFVGFPTALTKPRDVLGFLVLAGPVSCLISPTARVTSLWLNGIIQSSQYPFNWWTWWVGDTIGAIVLTPLILIWTAEPRDIWRRRRLSVTAPLTLVLVMITLFFLYATKWEHAATISKFEQRAQELAEAIKKDLKAPMETLHSIQSFYMVSPEVSRRDFKEFVGRFLRRHPSILSLSWNPYVPRSERRLFESSVQLEGFPRFRIKERSGNGKFRRARNRLEYVPLQYVEPLSRNATSLGFDAASDPVQLEAIKRARDSGKPTATGWININQGKKKHLAFLVFLPVYVGKALPKSIKQRRQGLLGYATAAIRIEDFISVALNPFTLEDMELTLIDPGTPPHNRVAYIKSVNRQTVKPFTALPRPGPLTWSTTFDVAGRSWMLSFSQTPGILGTRQNLQSWATGAVGLLISALLGGYLLFATGHTYEVEKLAEKLQLQTGELTKANKVKEEFLSVMSHELRTPLAVMTGYLEVIRDGALGDLNPKQREVIDKIGQQTEDELSMINEILHVTQMESAALDADYHRINISNLIATLKESYGYLRDKSVDLKWEFSPDLPTVVTDGSKLRQILQNLINNAIKFTERGEITISVRYLAEIKYLEFKVSDTGIGIHKDSLPLVFEKFWQADSSDPRSHGGTGLGLYVVKRFAQLLKGEVSVESMLGKGTTFTVRIPAIVASIPEVSKPSHDGSNGAEAHEDSNRSKEPVEIEVTKDKDESSA